MTREAPAHLMVEHADARTPREKTRIWARRHSGMSGRDSLRAPWRVWKQYRGVLADRTQCTRSQPWRRSRWPCGRAAWSGGLSPRGVGFTMTHQARRGSGGHRVPKLHCRIRQHGRASPAEAVDTTCGSSSVLESPVESLGRTGVDQWFPVKTSVRSACSQGRAAGHTWLDGRSSLK